MNNHLIVTDDSDSDTEWESNSSDDEVDELEGDELVESVDGCLSRWVISS